MPIYIEYRCVNIIHRLILLLTYLIIDDLNVSIKMLIVVGYLFYVVVKIRSNKIFGFLFRIRIKSLVR